MKLARRTPPLRLSYIGFMIEMQYNFPLLSTQGKQWQQRLAAAVAALSPEDFDELRPTYRQQRADHRAIAAQWLHSDPGNTFITCAGHHGILVSLLAAGLVGKPIAGGGRHLHRHSRAGRYAWLHARRARLRS